LGDGTTGDGLGDGSVGNCVIFTGSFFWEEFAIGSEGIGIINSNPCSARERYNIGRINVWIEPGKLFKIFSDMMFLITPSHLEVPA
jgi:hypothetical protein